MAAWFWYAVVAALLYAAHQIFTWLAADRIGEGLGSFVVEASAALSIFLYLVLLWLTNRWDQKWSGEGILWSVLAGLCVGAGTIAFSSSFKEAGRSRSCSAILAGSAAIMAIAGIFFFHETLSWQRPSACPSRSPDCFCFANHVSVLPVENRYAVFALAFSKAAIRCKPPTMSRPPNEEPVVVLNFHPKALSQSRGTIKASGRLLDLVTADFGLLRTAMRNSNE
jgi:transporter family protein